MNGPIGAPRHVTVTGQIHLFRKLDVPTLVSWIEQIAFERSRFAFRRQEILMVRRERVCRQAPLPEIVPAGDCLRRGPGVAEHGQHQGGKNCDDSDDHQQFDQGKCA